MKEFRRIKKFFSPLAKSRINGTSLDNDAALLELSSLKNLVVTTDTLVEKIHFGLTDNPCLIAKKLMRINLSDLAAMGSSSKYFLVTIGVPKSIERKNLKELYIGFKDILAFGGGEIIGGDLVRSNELFVSIAATGFCQVKNNKKNVLIIERV